MQTQEITNFDKQIILPLGEKVMLSELFSNKENCYNLFNLDLDFYDIIETIYKEINRAWHNYEKKHGRKIYCFADDILTQIRINNN